MEVKRLSGALSDPSGKGWTEVPTEHVSLSGAPIGSQPSRYERAVWADRPYGLVYALKVQGAHDGETLYLRLEWSSPTKGADGTPLPHPTEGPDAFPDSAAVMFPANGEATLETMGSDKAPVDVWRWAAGAPDTVENLVASGIGTTRAPDGSSDLWAKAESDNGHRQVVFGRPVKPSGADGLTTFAPGDSAQVAFAIWTGANQERAGIKSISPIWINLTLEG